LAKRRRARRKRHRHLQAQVANIAATLSDGRDGTRMAAERRDALEHCWPRRKPGAPNREAVEPSWLVIWASHFQQLAHGSVNTASLRRPSNRPPNKCSALWNFSWTSAPSVKIRCAIEIDFPTMGNRKLRALSDACLFSPTAHRSKKSSALEHHLRPARQKHCTDR
jgi:hypothetical protein